MKCYLGVDIGSISTKGVIIDEKIIYLHHHIYGQKETQLKR